MSVGKAPDDRAVEGENGGGIQEGGGVGRGAYIREAAEGASTTSLWEATYDACLLWESGGVVAGKSGDGSVDVLVEVGSSSVSERGRQGPGQEHGASVDDRLKEQEGELGGDVVGDNMG